MDLKELTALNPLVDPAKVEEARDTIRELRSRGVSRAEYNLASPHNRVGPLPNEKGADPRTVRLKANR